MTDFPAPNLALVMALPPDHKGDPVPTLIREANRLGYVAHGWTHFEGRKSCLFVAYLSKPEPQP